jgi:23S rRNA A2030 N6-methylase RlmJ
MNYRHAFHAGNFADVFKHALLTRLLIAAGNKPKPYLYLDTHAGMARYDLMHPWAQKAREYEGGIGRIWKAKDAPEMLIPYLGVVRALNPAGTLRFYPGSPLIARHFVRSGDRMVLVGSAGAIAFSGNRLKVEGAPSLDVKFDLDKGYQDAYDAAIGHFAEAVVHDRPFATPPEIHLAVLALVEEAYRFASATIDTEGVPS